VGRVGAVVPIYQFGHGFFFLTCVCLTLARAAAGGELDTWLVGACSDACTARHAATSKEWQRVAAWDVYAIAAMQQGARKRVIQREMGRPPWAIG